MNNLFKVHSSVNDETAFVRLLFFTFYSEAITDLKIRERNLYEIHTFIISIPFLVLFEFSFEEREW